MSLNPFRDVFSKLFFNFVLLRAYLFVEKAGRLAVNMASKVPAISEVRAPQMEA